MGANMKILVDNNELLAYKVQDLNIVSNFNTHTKLILNLKLKNPFNMFNKNIEIIKKILSKLNLQFSYDIFEKTWFDKIVNQDMKRIYIVEKSYISKLKGNF